MWGSEGTAVIVAAVALAAEPPVDTPCLALGPDSRLWASGPGGPNLLSLQGLDLRKDREASDEQHSVTWKPQPKSKGPVALSSAPVLGSNSQISLSLLSFAVVL